MATIPLPPGWVQYEAPGGIPFYFHQESNESTWTHPAAPTPPHSAVNNDADVSTNNNNKESMPTEEYLTSPARTRAIIETKKERLRERLTVRDGILQPDVGPTVEAYCKSCVETGTMSLNDAAEETTKLLAENYVGSGDICAILIDWLNLLKPPTGGEAAAKSHVCQMISQRVPHAQVDDVDALLLKTEHAPAWLGMLLEEPEYRTLLIELSNQRKGSILFECCVKAIAEKGFHDEVARTAGTATAHYVVFLKTLCSSIRKLVSIVEKSGSTPPPVAGSSTATNNSPTKRSRVISDDDDNTRPVFFDAFGKTEAELIRLAESAPHALALVHTVLSELELRPSLNSPSSSSSSTTTTSAIELSPQFRALCSRLRQRLKNPFPLSLSRSLAFQRFENNDESVRKSIDDMERVVADIVSTEDYDVCPKVVRLYTSWKELMDANKLTPEQHRTVAESFCEKRFMNRALDSLFRPFRSDITVDVRTSCAKLLAMVAGCGAESVDLAEALKKSSEICNSVGPGGVPSQVHGLTEHVAKHPTVSIASLIWANTLLVNPTFQKSMSFFTGVASMCRLCEVISREHPLHRQYILSLLRCALELRSVTDKRVVEYCDLVIESMVRLACDGYVMPVLEYWTAKAESHDSSSFRSFLGGMMKLARPPFSIEFKTKFRDLLDSSAGIRAVSGGGFEFQELKRKFLAS